MDKILNQIKIISENLIKLEAMLITENKIDLPKNSTMSLVYEFLSQCGDVKTTQEIFDHLKQFKPLLSKSNLSCMLSRGARYKEKYGIVKVNSRSWAATLTRNT